MPVKRDTTLSLSLPEGLRLPAIPGYALIWFLLVLVALLCRPLTPIDETRALSVAWEMWDRGNFLVPHINGEPYSHKPPLLQWLIHFTWLLFGVQEWTARAIAPLFGLANLVATARLARRLWPDSEVEHLAPWILLGFTLWGFWTTLTMYDMLLIFFTLIGLHGVVSAASGATRSGWLLTGAAIGGGILAKGPVILLLILPAALLAPWWRGDKPESGWRSWYTGLLAALLLGAAIGLAWAAPAGLAGGEAYRKAIFWGQSAGRVAHSFAHRRPFGWYLMLSPLLLFPWVLWPPFWRSLDQARLDRGLRFCLAQAGTVFLLFSLISGKQVYYLLPMFPALSLAIARFLSTRDIRVTQDDQGLIAAPLILAGAAFILLPLFQKSFGLPDVANEAARIAEAAPYFVKFGAIGLGLFLLAWHPRSHTQAVRGVSLVSFCALITAHLVYAAKDPGYYDMQPMAARVAELQRQGAAVAHFESYNGDFQFLGRLHNALQVIESPQALTNWVKSHPDGHVLLVARADAGKTEDGAEFAQYYRGSKRIMLWRASTLLSHPERLRQFAG